MAGNLGNRWQSWWQEQLLFQSASGKQREGPRNDMSKLCSQSLQDIESISPKLPQTTPPSGDQVSKHLSLWGVIPIQTTALI